jgi:pyruvate dehydrogenase E2 component (dihydrolipoamide acetyltransferase)
MQVTLSCDHRAIDGVMGAEFLKEFKRILEHPQELLLPAETP